MVNFAEPLNPPQFAPFPKGLNALMGRTAVRFDPNHEDGEQTPTVLFDHFYETNSFTNSGMLRGASYLRALFWLVWASDEAEEDGGFSTIMVPFRAWRYDERWVDYPDQPGSSHMKEYWKLADRSSQRARDCLWQYFGFVTY